MSRRRWRPLLAFVVSYPLLPPQGDSGLPSQIAAFLQQVVAASKAGFIPQQLGDHGEQLRSRVKDQCRNWTGQQLALAFLRLHDAATILHKDEEQRRVLLADLETELRRREGPRDGWTLLLWRQVHVAKETGRTAAVVDAWLDLWRSFDGPKRHWVAAEAGRVLITQCEEPARAEDLLTRALVELESASAWAEPTRAAIAADEDLFIPRRDRAEAGSWRDAHGQLLLLRGYAREQIGNLLPAIGDLAAASVDFRATGNVHRSTNCLHNLASIWLQLGRYDLALAVAQEALTAYARGFEPDAQGVVFPDDNGVLAMRKLIAKALHRRGDLEGAESGFQAVTAELVDKGVGETNVDALTGHAELLLQLMKRSPSADRERCFHALMDRVDHYCGSNHEQLVWCRAELLRAEMAIRKGEFPDAKRRLEGLEVPLTRHRHRALQVRRLGLLGRVQSELGDWRGALVSYSAAADLVGQAVMAEELWRLEGAATTYISQFGELLAGAHEVIESAAGDTTATPDVMATVYRLVQRFHGSEALCRSMSANAVPPGEMTAAEEHCREDLRVAEAEHRKVLARAPRNPAAARRRNAQLEACQRKLESCEAALASCRRLNNLAPLGLTEGKTLVDVQQHLQPGELLIECIEADGNAWAFLVTDHDCTTQLLPRGDAWCAAVEALRGWVESSDDEKDVDRIEALRQVAHLVLPADGWFDQRLRSGSVKRLLWSPEGTFASVPLAALPWREKPLVAAVPVVHVVSGSQLVQHRELPVLPPTSLRLLALGNPKYPRAAIAMLASRSLVGGDFPALPAAAEELLAVARHFAEPGEATQLEQVTKRVGLVDLDEEIHGTRFRVLLGAMAKESALRADALRGVDVLHFACHGEASTEAPAMSFLALSLDAAAAAECDGLLRLGELARLRGDYALVVLSACRTGVGFTRGHDAAAGLAWAAQLAGARRVLASMWRVPDRDACELVTDFYGRWLGDRQPTDVALAAVQRQAIGVRPVRAWATFTLWSGCRE